MKPIEIINALRETEPYIETIYTQGGCYRFHLFLRKLFPCALPVKNKTFDHVGTLIDGECYDINGVVDWNFYAMSADEIEEANKWCFTDHNFLLLGECPVCEEPLLT